jgi:leucyl-tRNA synthetase
VSPKILQRSNTIPRSQEYLNFLGTRQEVTRDELQTMLVLLAPLAPYVTEELWERLGNLQSIHRAPWLTYEAEALRSDAITLPVQVNGRLRDHIEVQFDVTEDEIKQQTLVSERVQRFIAGHKVQRLIYVPGRLVNIVTS